MSATKVQQVSGLSALGLESFQPAQAAAAARPESDAASLSIDAVMRIPVTVQVVLGSTTMPVANLMKLSQGMIVGLDNKVGEPVDVVVNGRVVGRHDRDRRRRPRLVARALAAR